MLSFSSLILMGGKMEIATDFFFVYFLKLDSCLFVLKQHKFSVLGSPATSATKACSVP